MSVNRLSAFLPFACLLGAAVAQTPGVLLDINQTGSGPVDSSPFGFTTLGSLVLFSATTQTNGAELWAADLATNAVYLLADIAPGTASSAPRDLVAMGGRIYFFADDGVHGRELWSTDGTTAGTQLVVDLAPGGSSSPSELVVVGSRLFFSAYTPVGGELVVSDGTAAGTQVIDINPSGHSLPNNLTVIQNEVWFRASTPALGPEPWRSDGTPGGTVLVADTVAGTSGGFGDSFTPVGNRVLFVANASVWTSDGTPAGTSMLMQGAQKLLGAGGLAYLMLSGTLYRSGGTAANTVQVASGLVPMFANVTQFTPFGAHFVIRVQGGFPTPVDATFLSDGTAAGTVLLPGIAMQDCVAEGNTLWFGSSGGDGAGNELRRTDGTVAGTTLIADIVPGPVGSTPQGLAVIAPGHVMFAAATATGREPWRSLGFALGTLPVANIAPEVTQSANPAEIVDAAGRLFFRAWDGAVETLWACDGTAAGTHVVVPAGPSQPLNIEQVVAIGDRVFFRGNTAATGGEVMVSDGTAAGTYGIDTWPGPDGSNPSSLVAAADRLYFLSYTPWGSRSLWHTNGTTTVSVSAPIAVGTIGAVGAFGRGAVFAFNNPLVGAGSEPWYTDGTVAGTVPLGDLLPGLDSSEPSNIRAFGGRCFFTARYATTSTSKQLWVTDGTAAGTQPFFAGVPGAPDHFDRLTVVRDKLFFAARTAAHGLELWVSDGTLAGTHLVLDTVPGPSGMTPFEPRAFGDLLLYRVSATGFQGLWRSDGTAAGTFLVATTWGPDSFATGGRYAWFRGSDVAAGAELWRTDGTLAGTARFADLLPGDGGSDPSDFALSNGRLYFAAGHAALGRELWTLDLDATTQPIGFGCAFGGASPSRLWGDDPAMGTTATFRVVGAPPIGISVALFTHFVPGHRPLGPAGCDLFVDYNPLILGVELFQNGAATHPLAVPIVPALVDQSFRVQVLTLSGTTVLELGLSNAVTLTIGS